MKIYAITCNQTANIQAADFYLNLDKAKIALAKIVKERRNNLGVHVHKDSDVEFTFTLGWEESFVRWSIVEITVNE